MNTDNQNVCLSAFICVHQGPFHYLAAMSARRRRARSGARSWRSALASIWRIRSRVTSNSWPISSSVCSRSQPMPKRMRITFSSLGERVLRMPAVSSRTLDSITASTGEPTQRSSMRSPRADSPSRPTGVSSETGSREMVLSFWTFSTGMSMRRPISSFVGVRPSSFSSSRVARRNLFMLSKPKPAPAEAKPPRSMARRIIVSLFVILILAAIGFGVWSVFFYTPPMSPNIVPLSGRIEGDDSAVSPKTSGRILEIRVREGDSVSTGDIIAVLDDEQLRARVEQAQAQLQQAEAKARSARDQIAVLDEQLRQEEANVAQQEAAHDIASFDKEAYTRLAQSGAVSERQGKQAVSTADQQAAAVAGAKRRVAGVNMQLAQQQAA